MDLLPSLDLREAFLEKKKTAPKTTINQILAAYFPKSLLNALQELWWEKQPLQQYKNSELDEIASKIHAWQLTPSGTEGYRTAEVTRGGVDVSQISSKTMQVNDIEGLYFVGEVLDVTGHLGGFNFQWAWSSGFVAGKNAAESGG